MLSCSDIETVNAPLKTELTIAEGSIEHEQRFIL